MEAIVKWESGMSFEARQDGHTLRVDASPEFGGQDLGPRPKTLMLTALGGCTAMDVVSILGKMRVAYDAFEVRVSAELTDEHPRVFREVLVKYVFRGKDLPMDKLEKAVALSQDKYCGVSAMLAKAAPVRHEIIVED